MEPQGVLAVTGSENGSRPMKNNCGAASAQTEAVGGVNAKSWNRVTLFNKGGTAESFRPLCVATFLITRTEGINDEIQCA